MPERMELSNEFYPFGSVTENSNDPTLGAIHKVRHAFLANFDPLPSVTLCHTSPDPPKVRHTSRTPSRFLVGLVQNPDKKTAVQILSQLFAGVLSEGLLSGRFCPGWFLSVPPSVIIHMLQQKVKHHFKFHVSYVR